MGRSPFETAPDWSGRRNSAERIGEFVRNRGRPYVDVDVKVTLMAADNEGGSPRARVQAHLHNPAALQRVRRDAARAAVLRRQGPAGPGAAGPEPGLHQPRSR